MTSNSQRESAKIFQFPVRGRFATPAPFSDLMSMQVANALSGNWYHEEAIQEAEEAERARKN